MSERGKTQYVERVRAATHRLFQDLREQNRRLRLSLAVLGQGRETAPPELGELERWRAEQQGLLELLDAVERETQSLEERLSRAENRTRSRGRECP